MTQAVKPMLAAPLNWDLLKYPVYASPKVDGVRTVISGGIAWSRTWKMFPNRSLQERVCESALALESLDGELVVGSPADGNVFQRTTSGVMAQAGDPDVQLLAFDLVNMPGVSYGVREAALAQRSRQFPPWVRLLEQVTCFSSRDVEAAEEEFLSQGYEGLVIRSPRAFYKNGRATARGGELLKLKRYTDTEAVVLGVEELMHNGNEAARDVQGVTRRSHVQAGMMPGGVLGALNVALLSDRSVVFSVGTGFTGAQRAALWVERDKLPGRVIRVKYMQHGVLESTGVPRHPVYQGFREEQDL